MTLKAITATISLSIATAGSAQEIPPTETDLRSAYCVEIIKSEIAFYQQAITALPNTTESSYRNELQGYLAADNARLRKLQLYLVPRIQYMDMLGIVSAQRAAKDDLDRIGLLSGCMTDQCTVPTSGDSTAVHDACVNACTAKVAPDLKSIQQKAQKCRDLDWLPF